MVGVDAAGVRRDLLDRAPDMLIGRPAGGIENLGVRHPLRARSDVKHIPVDEEVGVYLAADRVWQAEQWRGREATGRKGVGRGMKAARIWELRRPVGVASTEDLLLVCGFGMQAAVSSFDDQDGNPYRRQGECNGDYHPVRHSIGAYHYDGEGP